MPASACTCPSQWRVQVHSDAIQQGLARVQSLRCAERMRQLVVQPGAETRLEEGALLLVRCTAQAVHA